MSGADDDDSAGGGCFSDETLTCRDCKEDFKFTVGEQEFYEKKGLANKPTRCKACARIRRESASLQPSASSAASSESSAASSASSAAEAAAGSGRLSGLLTATLAAVVNPRIVNQRLLVALKARRDALHL